ncbi:hypothetical protein BDR04DRAFT_1184101 [Suillus decipiens]|nr:hypothetical protein BDR04DRAFT_1184101 [Suillus decipiens]
MDKEIAELKSYLPEWTSAKRSKKWGVFTAIAQAARLFAPKIDLGQWKKQKQMYKIQLFNNKKKKEKKGMIKYGRKWTPRMVIYQQNWEEVLKRIEDEFGAKPGAPGMFKHYQMAVKRVMVELDEDKLEKVKETAEEWLNNFPPPEVQAQVAWKKGLAYMEHFSKEMWRQCRMRVMNKGHRLCSGNDKAVIPWSTIIHSQDDFLARTFLPADVDLKEPSKLQNWDMTALLNFWYAQQEAGKCPTFLFKAWKNKDSEMVPSVVSSKSPSPTTETIRKQKRAIHQSPEDSLTEAQSDTQETEEEADDDSADGRSPHKRARRVGNPSGAGQKLTVLKSLPKPWQTKMANIGALIEPLARMTWSMSHKPLDSMPQVTRGRGRK